MKAREIINKIVEHKAAPYVVASVILFFTSLPFLWTLASSFKSMSECFLAPPTYLPATPTLSAYYEALLMAPVPTYIMNSTIIAILTVGIALIAGTFTAYGLSQYRFKGSNIALILFLFTRVIPPISLLLPFYLVLIKMGLINTRIGVVIYTIYLCYPLVVWMLKGFFDAFPRELIDSAAVDGCSRTGTMFKIVMPVAAAGVMAVSVIAFMWTWNEFLAPYLYINTNNIKPLTVGIWYFVGDELTYWNRMCAAGVLAIIPSVTFFLLAQKYIVRGLTKGGLKF